MEPDHPERPHHDSKKDLCMIFSIRGILQYVERERVMYIELWVPPSAPSEPFFPYSTSNGRHGALLVVSCGG